MGKELIRGCMHALLEGKRRREKKMAGMHGGVERKLRREKNQSRTMKNLVVNVWLWLHANFVRRYRNTPHDAGFGW